MAIEITLVTDSYSPKLDATSRLNQQLISRLSRIYNVSVLTSADSTDRDFLRQEITAEGIRKKIRRIPVIFDNTRNIFLKPLRYIFFALGVVVYLLTKKSSRYIYIIHSSPPILLPLFALLIWLNKVILLNRKRTLLIIHDLYPDIVFSALRQRKINISWLESKLITITSTCYKQFDEIVCCSHGIQMRMMTKYFIEANRLHSLYNWSVDEYESLKIPLEKKQTQFLWIGNVGPLHLVSQVCAVLRLIATKIDSSTIQVFGNGRNANQMETNLIDLDTVKFKQHVPASVLREEYAIKSCITLVSLSAAASHCAMPSRIAYSLALGAPILYVTDTTKDNWISDFIRSNYLGTVLTADMTETSIIQSIVQLLKDYEITSISCRSCYTKTMSADLWSNEFISIINGEN